MKKILSLLVLGLVIVSCSNVKVIRNYDANPIPEGLKLSDIEKGIKRAGIHRGWIFREAGKNKLEGTVMVRSHKATVDIPYTKENYQINYVSSENLKYNATKNTIHRNYYRWIENLKRDIDRELLLLTAK